MSKHNKHNPSHNPNHAPLVDHEVDTPELVEEIPNGIVSSDSKGIDTIKFSVTIDTKQAINIDKENASEALEQCQISQFKIKPHASKKDKSVISGEKRFATDTYIDGLELIELKKQAKKSIIIDKQKPFRIEMLNALGFTTDASEKNRMKKEQIERDIKSSARKSLLVNLNTNSATKNWTDDEKISFVTSSIL